MCTQFRLYLQRDAIHQADVFPVAAYVTGCKTALITLMRNTVLVILQMICVRNFLLLASSHINNVKYRGINVISVYFCSLYMYAMSYSSNYKQ